MIVKKLRRSVLKRNSKLSLALHTLAHMAGDPDKVRTSADIAEHVGTNPVVVRRVLGKLREANLLTSEKGHSGGWALARDPRLISLADVYAALDEQLIKHDKQESVAKCSVEKNLHDRVSQVLGEAEKSILKKLSETSIGQLS